MNATTLNAMSLTQLTAIYNQHAAKQVKKFSCSKDAAVDKVLGVLPKAAKKSAAKKVGIGARIIELLRAGSSCKDTLTAIQGEFKGCATSIACVYWYNSKIRCGHFD